ncbi:MAG: molybdopterin-dependent oxidoreductase [Caldimonas sp.]
MTEPPQVALPHDPLAARLASADDRLRLSDWLPPQWGIVPRIRIGQRWISTLWALPIGAAALIVLIAVAQSPRDLPGVKAFIEHYPDIAQAVPSVVFYPFSEGSAHGGGYYDVHRIENMRHEMTILANEMNAAPVSVLHGALLRLRCENELGFKRVKWIAAIEFVQDFADLGAGQGGYNEDHEFYGYRMPI